MTVDVFTMAIVALGEENRLQSPSNSVTVDNTREQSQNDDPACCNHESDVNKLMLFFTFENRH